MYKRLRICAYLNSNGEASFIHTVDTVLNGLNFTLKFQTFSEYSVASPFSLVGDKFAHSLSIILRSTEGICFRS